MRFWLQIIRENNASGLLFFLSLIIIIMGLLSPLFIIHIFNRYITFGLEGTLFFLVIGALIVAVFEFIFRTLRHNFCSKIIVSPIKKFKMTLLKNYFDSEFYSENKRGSPKIKEILSSSELFPQILSSQNQSNVMDSLFSLLILGILFLLNINLALVFSVFIVVVLIIQNFYIKKLDKNKNSLKYNDETSISDDINYKGDFLKSINSFEFVGFNFLEKLNTQFVKSEKLAKIKNFQINLNNFVMVINSILIIGLGSTYVVNGSLTIGTLIGFNIFASRALQISISAQKSFFLFKDMNKFFSEISLFFKSSQNKDIGMKLSKLTGNIEITNLDFNFTHSSSFLFRNVSLSLKNNHITTIKGKNGSGKTTLCKILLGIKKPDSGEISIDNTNFEKFSMTWWRNQIGYIPQNTYCLKTSITENISIGNKKLNEQEINSIIQNIGLDEVLKKSNLNINEKLTEKVSFGIHKKIHLARVLASNNKIIIMDDPLQSLDKFGIVLVMNLLESFKKSNKTVICFSNDEKILNISDKVYDLDD